MDNGELRNSYDAKFILSGGTITRAERDGYNGTFYVTAGTKVKSVMTTETRNGSSSTYNRTSDGMYAGFGSYGVLIVDETTGKRVY